MTALLIAILISLGYITDANDVNSATETEVQHAKEIIDEDIVFF